MSSQQSVTHSASETRLIGRVKWFNNKAGYGFITVTDGPKSGSDIFVHHTAISVGNQQFKYLVQGEYVELFETKTTSGPHEFQAASVVGVKGGKLMCETRNEYKIARGSYKNAQSEDAARVVKAEVKTLRQKKAETVIDVPIEEDKKEWTLVKDASEKPTRARAPRKSKAVESK